MYFYCYSEFGDSTIASRLGDADYSYYFVLKAYIPLLQRLGETNVINALDEDFRKDAEQRISNGQKCYLFAFAPPHKIPLDMPCPVVPVFAWEYSSLPNREFINDPRDSWVDALESFGQAITHSSYAKRVVLADMPEDFPIESIPAPMWNKSEKLRQQASQRTPYKNHTISFGTVIIDSRDFAIETESISPASKVARGITTSAASRDMSRNINLDFGNTNNPAMMIGFYPSEGWGMWTKTSSPWIMLPSEISGSVRLTISAHAFGDNIGRDLKMHVGEHIVTLDLGADTNDFVFDLVIEQPSNFICFSNIDISAERPPVDPRTLGIGLAGLAIEKRDAEGSAEQPETTTDNAVEHHIDLEGVVYTSILNPQDGRKNWEDILTAFCLAFKDKEDATLILKMTYKDLGGYLDDVFTLFCQLHPFKCRVIVVHGYVSGDEYDALMASTTYIVNASRSEGQCLPLMEYMSAGIPAIAPDNTAMADYITEQNAFIVESSPEPHYWPHDPQQIFTTLWYRPSWESLYNAYLASYESASGSPEAYTKMSEQAQASLYQFCSLEVLTERLESLLTRVDAG